MLEARDRVGGRTWTTEADDGTPVDLGGQWVGPSQHHLQALLDELGLATEPTPTAGRSVLRMADRTVTYRGTIPRVRLGRPVVAVDAGPERVTVTTADGDTTAAADLVVAVPPHLAAGWTWHRGCRPTAAAGRPPTRWGRP